MDFLKQLASSLTAPFEAFLNAVKTKDVKQIFAGVRDLVRNAVFATEQISNTLKDIDVQLSGDDKHEMVLEYFSEVAIKKVNEVVDIPFISEKQEEALFRMILNALIKAAVRAFNKKGWKL